MVNVWTILTIGASLKVVTSYNNISRLWSLVLVLLMPDSFQSWFLVAHLHLWLCSLRLREEGKEGTFVLKEMVKLFWEDAEQKITALGVQWNKTIVLHNSYTCRLLLIKENILNGWISNSETYSMNMMLAFELIGWRYIWPYISTWPGTRQLAGDSLLIM